VGHAGTLDPQAGGVLLICLGQATRVSEYLMGSPKLYRARVLLGRVTETCDIEGAVLEERLVEVDRAAVEAALARFRGPILQTPPMYSAVHHEGERLYRLARRGVTVERTPRPVEIYHLELVAWQPPEIELDVTCSPGTYIRSLAHDLGLALGCGACLAGLTRLASGDFRLEEAVPLDELTAERLPSLLYPLDAALRRFPVIRLAEAAARAVCAGQPVTALSPEGEAMLARAYSPAGELLAVVEYRAGAWWPHKVFGGRGDAVTG